MGTITESAKAFMPKLSGNQKRFSHGPGGFQHEERTGKEGCRVSEGDGMRRSMKMSADTV